MVHVHGAEAMNLVRTDSTPSLTLSAIERANPGTRWNASLPVLTRSYPFKEPTLNLKP